VGASHREVKDPFADHLEGEQAERSLAELQEEPKHQHYRYFDADSHPDLPIFAGKGECGRVRNILDQ
jgi:hypothetical protein